MIPADQFDRRAIRPREERDPREANSKGHSNHASAGKAGTGGWPRYSSRRHSGPESGLELETATPPPAEPLAAAHSHDRWFPGHRVRSRNSKTRQDPSLRIQTHPYSTTDPDGPTSNLYRPQMGNEGIEVKCIQLNYDKFYGTPNAHSRFMM